MLSILNEGIENPLTGERDKLTNAPTLFQAAQRIGRALRMVYEEDGGALEQSDVKFDVSFLFGGQIEGRRLRLFMITPPAISSNAPSTRLTCRSASTNTANPFSTAR